MREKLPKLGRAAPRRMRPVEDAARPDKLKWRRPEEERGVRFCGAARQAGRGPCGMPGAMRSGFWEKTKRNGRNVGGPYELPCRRHDKQRTLGALAPDPDTCATDSGVRRERRVDPIRHVRRPLHSAAWRQKRISLHQACCHRENAQNNRRKGATARSRKGEELMVPAPPEPVYHHPCQFYQILVYRRMAVISENQASFEAREFLQISTKIDGFFPVNFSMMPTSIVDSVVRP